MDELLSQQEERYEELIEVSSLSPLLSGVARELFPNIGEEVSLSSSPEKVDEFFRNVRFKKYSPPRKIFKEIDFSYEIRSSTADSDEIDINLVSNNFMAFVTDKINFIFLVETTTLNSKVESYLYIYKKSEEPISMNSYVEKIKMFRPFLFDGCGIICSNGTDPDKNIFPFTEMDYYIVTISEKHQRIGIHYFKYRMCIITNNYGFDFEKFRFIPSKYLLQPRLEDYERNISDRKFRYDAVHFSIELRLRNGIVYEILAKTNLILFKYRFDSPIHSFKVGYLRDNYYLIVKGHNILHDIKRRADRPKFLFLSEMINICEKSKVMGEYSSFVTKIIFENTLRSYGKIRK